MMKLLPNIAVLMLCGMMGTGLVGCRKEDAAAAKAKAKGRVPIVPVTVETRSDGLAYLPGSSTPFTGVALTPHPDSPWLVKMKEPYTDGKRDGDKLVLFKNGDTKSLRRYDKGTPKYAATFHKNGQKKYEVNLDAADRGVGPYSRWYDTGVLEATAGLDSEERWHGEFKEWTPEGVLKTHLVFKHGLLEQIIFESPESQAARKAKGVELQSQVTTPAPPPETESE
jgi:hypothetical protein